MILFLSWINNNDLQYKAISNYESLTSEKKFI